VRRDPRGDSLDECRVEEPARRQLAKPCRRVLDASVLARQITRELCGAPERRDRIGGGCTADDGPQLAKLATELR
jgi:hypothetical protein